MIIPQQLIQKIHRIITHKPLIIRIDESMPRALRKPAQNIIVLRIQLNIVLIEIIEQILGPQNPCDLNQLVRITVPVEKRLFPENHAGEHGAQAPHIEAVIVLLEIHQQLRPLKVARRDADVVLGACMVEFRQPPVDEAEFAGVVVDHDVVGLDVAVHDALGVAEVEGFEEFVDVEADVEVVEFGVEGAEVGVVDVFEDEAGGFALAVAHDVEEGDDVGAAAEVLEDFDFALDFFLFDRFEHFDHAFLVVDYVDSFEDFAVFASSWGRGLLVLVSRH